MSQPGFRSLAFLTTLGLFVSVQVPYRADARQDDAGAQARTEIAKLFQGPIQADTNAILESLPSLKELAEQRQQVTERLMELSVREFLAPPSPSGARGTFAAAVRDYLQWSEQNMEAKLDLSENDQGHIDLLAQEVAKLRQLEEIYRKLAQEAMVSVTPKNLLEVQAHRLSLESRLAKIKTD